MLKSKCNFRMWSFPPNFPSIFNLLLILALTFSASFLKGASAQTCVDNDDCFPRCCDLDTGKCNDSPCLASEEFEGMGKPCECNEREVQVCEKLNKGACLLGKIRPFCCEGQVQGEPEPQEPGPQEPGPQEPETARNAKNFNRMRNSKRKPASSSRRSSNSRAQGRSSGRSNSRQGEMQAPRSKSGNGKGSEADMCDCTKGSVWRTQCLRMKNGCCDPERRIDQGCCYTREAHLKCTSSDYDIKQFLYES